MKGDFSSFVLADKCRAILDGPDAFATRWLAEDSLRLTRFRRQQGGGGVIFWKVIIGDTIVGHCFVEDVLKMNSENSVNFF